MGRFAGLNPTMRPARTGGTTGSGAVPPPQSEAPQISEARQQAMRGSNLKPEAIAALLRSIRAKIAEEARERAIPVTDTEAMRTLAKSIAEQQSKAAVLNVEQHNEVVREVLAHIGGGYGLLSPLLAIPDIEDIMVNTPDDIWIGVKGQLREKRHDIRFRDDDEVVALVQRLAAEAHRQFNFAEPILDAKLPDGNRINALLGAEHGGVSLRGTAVAIRTHKAEEDAVELRTMEGEGMVPRRNDHLCLFGSTGEVPLYDPDMDVGDFFRLCVQHHITMLFAGPVGSGKTTLMNALLLLLPELCGDHIRVATVEDVAELTNFVPNIVRLQARQANSEGKGEVTLDRLVAACLRQYPDIIVVGEVRLLEGAAYMVAINSGHAGSMTSIHAQSPRAAMLRLQGLLRSGSGLDERTCRDYMKAVHLVVQMGRDSRHGNQRAPLQVASIDGLDETGHYIITPLYTWQDGYFRPTGARPAWAPLLSGLSLVE